MDWYRYCKLEKNDDGYTMVISLNSDSTEFASEFMENISEGITGLDEKIKQLIDEKFSDVKINSVKLMAGTLMIASLPFMMPKEVKAADTTTATTTQQVVQTSAINWNTTGVVTATALNLRSGPGTWYPIINKLYQGTTVRVIGQSGDWFKVQLNDGTIGWVSTTYMQLDMRLQKINTVISTAKSLIGTPYVWGGESLQQGGFDCSGFTKYVFGQVGYTLSRVSRDQALQGIYVSKQNLQPGDLVFFSSDGSGVVNHVGIYIGNGQMIHSPKSGDVVKTTDITTSYWQVRLVTARRII